MGLCKEDLLSIFRDSLYLDTAGVTETTPLFSSNLIDSFALASLLVEIETRAGFTIDPLDISLDNLDTIERILRFVSSRTGPASA